MLYSHQDTIFYLPIDKEDMLMLRVNLTNSAAKADSYVQDLQQAHTWLQAGAATS